MSEENQSAGVNYAVPLAIIIAGALVAGALYFRSGSSGGALPPPNSGPTEAQLTKMRAISPSDHWRGPEQARVVLVEYSDLECPFCKQFHLTLKQLLAEQADVAWVYRHFPLDQLHPKARAEAEATECVAELGGNDKFWQYLDKIFEITPSNNGLDPTQLPKLAAEIGVDQTDFAACVASGRHRERVQADLDNAVATGGTGTPFTIVVTADKKIPLSGSLPLESLTSVISELLKK